MEIRVEIAGSEKQSLAGLEGDAVEQQCRQNAGVAGVRLAQFQRGADLGHEFGVVVRDVGDAPGKYGREQGPEHRGRQRDPCREQRPQSVGIGLAFEQTDVRLQLVDGQSAQQFDSPRRLAESGKRFESAERDNEFGLVAAVLVVANRRFHGNAECVLTTKTLVGLNGAGMRLKRQRFFRRKQLEQEWESLTECLEVLTAEFAFGFAVQDLEQRLASGFGDHARRVTRVRAQPQFRFGMIRRSRKTA